MPLGRGDQRPVTEPAPRVSVIIPAYHSYATIGACLEALSAQTYQDFETIVINSSLEEMTEQIVTTEFPDVVFEQSPIRLLPHAARNRGAGLARGEILVFTDPDCTARPDWLEQLVAACDAGHPIVGGSMALGGRRWFEQGIHVCKFYWLLEGAPAGPRQIVATANVCVTRQVWDKIGPLDGNLFCGDAVFCWRATAHGIQPWFEPQAVVEHRHAENPTEFWHERLERGREFAEVRAGFEGWSRRRAGTYLVLFPIVVLLVVLRTGREASRSGWGQSFLLTLPVQFMGQLAWCLGEARAHWDLAKHGPKSGTVPNRQNR